MSDSVVERVRKLLALADSPNVHEAAAAAAKAQALIAAHRLQDLLDANDAMESVEVIDDRDHPLETGRRVRRYKVNLACTLAELNGCVAYTLAMGKQSAIVLVGVRSDMDVVRALYVGLIKRIEWLSATHGEGQSKKWHEAFRVGAVNTIAHRLKHAADDAHSALQPTALARVDPALAARSQAVDRFVTERLRLKPGRSLRLDASAYHHGKRAADQLPLP